ncbi:MAG: hypothetical protein AAB805_02385 [Patescibacteria group bacterium]
MITNVEVSKQGSETSISLIRRFSKKMQGAGIVKKVRKIRYAKRNSSPLTRKKRALKRITRFAERERLRKLGKEE